MPPAADLNAALNDLPLFPLRQAVLLPGMLLPLHIFEARYRQLVRDVLERHHSLAIAYVVDPQADMSGDPAIAQVAGAGTIVEHAELPGGRYNIMLLGRARVQLQELRFQPPYRRAMATVLKADKQEVPPLEMAALHTAAGSFAALVRESEPTLELRLPKRGGASATIDAIAHQLVLDPRARQKVLETIELRARAQLVTEVLTIQRTALAPSTGPAN